MKDINEKKLNPWISIITKPGLTIQQVLKSESETIPIILVMMAYIASIIRSPKFIGLSLNLPYYVTFPLVLILSGILGFIAYYTNGLIMAITGKWFGGNADSRSLRPVSGWANIPVIYGIVLAFTKIAIIHKGLVSSSASSEIRKEFLSILAFITLLEILLSLLAFIIFIKCLASVQNFSKLKAFVYSIISAVIFVIIYFVVGISLFFFVLSLF